MGSRTERMLLEDVRELGYYGLKVDQKMGSFHSDHDGGDIIIGKGVLIPVATGSHDDFNGEVLTDLYVIEEKYKKGKSQSSKYATEDEDKIDGMIQWAQRMGATPLLAVRWSTRTEWSPGSTHYLKDVRDIERTPSGNISISPDQAVESFQTTEEFFSESKVTHPI